MIGAIAGDIIGSPYEYDNIRTTYFPLFTNESHYTDDTALTVATAHALLNDRDYKAAYQMFAYQEPGQDYGVRFRQYVFSPEGLQPYNSLGDGSAMRVSPVGWFCDTLEEVLSEAYKSAAVSHNHPEGILGVQCTAAMVFLARTGSDKIVLRDVPANRFGYQLDDLEGIIGAERRLAETCAGTMPPATAAFLLGNDWESRVRIAVPAGDSDTISCITGAIAEVVYGVSGCGRKMQGSSK